MSRMDTFWKNVREIEEGLPPVVFILHLESREIFEVESAIAAVRIVEGAHRIATAPEIEEFKAQQERRRNLAVAQGKAASGRLV